MATKPKKKSKGVRWWLLFGFTGIIDLAQIIIDLTGVGIAVSEAIEVIMPFVLIGALQFGMKVSLISRPARLLSIVGATGLDAITGGLAPFWVVDMWYIWHDVKKEDAEATDKYEQDLLLENNIRQPYNDGGMRMPRMQQENMTGNTYETPMGNTSTGNTISRPANFNGVRPPSGGLKTVLK